MGSVFMWSLVSGFFLYLSGRLKQDVAEAEDELMQQLAADEDDDR